MLGCPYNLHPEKPWLRRTIRGAIATGVVVASPLLIVGAATAAVTVLPTVGIFRLVKRARTRRYVRTAMRDAQAAQPMTLDPNNEGFHIGVDLDIPFPGHDMLGALRHIRFIAALNTVPTAEDDFPLSIFTDMDVEHLFTEDEEAAPVIDVKEHV